MASTSAGSNSLINSKKGTSKGQSSEKDTTTKDKDHLPRQVLHEVDHYKQRFNWDCGVSCVLMLLPPEQRSHFLDNFDSICQEEGFGKSTWTVDLCYLLKRFDIRHCMYSTVMGVNEDFKKFSYYDSIMELDRDRVQRRFDEAESNGIAIRSGYIRTSDLQDHLAKHGPAIVLVDAGLLVCDLCKHNKLRVEFRRCFGGSYSGHYILVVGYSSRRVLYRDPALRPRLCAAAPGPLAAARRAPGTDHDVILVYNKYTDRVDTRDKLS